MLWAVEREPGRHIYYIYDAFIIIIIFLLLLLLLLLYCYCTVRDYIYIKPSGKIWKSLLGNPLNGFNEEITDSQTVAESLSQFLDVQKRKKTHATSSVYIYIYIYT